MNGSLREDARAGFTWYPGDWLSDEGVRSVSFAAKGLWIGMLCLMARSAKRGKLLDHVGANADSKWLANQLGGEPKEIDLLLAELERENVFSRHEGGIICRKMWRPTNLSEIRAEAGRLGALAKHQQTNVAKPGNGGKGKERNGTEGSSMDVVHAVDMPLSLRTPAFLKAWADWRQYRKETRHALTPSTSARQLKKLEAVGPAVAVAMIEQSIEKGWRGLFEVQEDGQGKKQEYNASDRLRPASEVIAKLKGNPDE